MSNGRGHQRTWRQLQKMREENALVDSLKHSVQLHTQQKFRAHWEQSGEVDANPAPRTRKPLEAPFGTDADWPPREKLISTQVTPALPQQDATQQDSSLAPLVGKKEVAACFEARPSDVAELQPLPPHENPISLEISQESNVPASSSAILSRELSMVRSASVGMSLNGCQRVS